MTPAVRQILADSWRKGAGVWLDFANDRYFQQGVGSGIDLISVSRASIGTDLLPSSPSGASYLTFAANTPRRSALAGGLLVEEARTQLSAFPTAPQTETITIGSTGTYTLWVNGSGSATVAAGTAVGSGFGTATNGTPVVFAISSTGTVGITVTGSLQALQVELGTWGSSFIPQAATVRAADVTTLRVGLPSSLAYTIYSRSRFLAPTAFATNQFTMEMADGSANERAGLRREGSTALGTITLVSGGAGLGGPTPAGTVIAQGARATMAYAVAAGRQAFCSDGGAIGVMTAASPPTVMGSLHIGTRSTGILPINGSLDAVAVWPFVALSDSDLKRITAL